MVKNNGRILRGQVSVVSFALWLLLSLGMIPTAQALSGKTTVTANIVEVIEVLLWPNEKWSPGEQLTPNDAVRSDMLEFIVRSNMPWGIEIGSDSPTGALRQTGSTGKYVAEGLMTANQLEWSIDGTGPWTPATRTAMAMVSNMAPTGATGSSVKFQLRFIPTFTDAPLKDGTYRIELEYTVGITY